MGIIKLKYKIQHFDDGTSHCIAVSDEDNLKDFHTLEISQNINEIHEPVNFGIATENITKLIISHCQLSHLPNNLYFHNLKEFDMSYNYFRYIPNFVFQYNPNMQKLNVSNNMITDFNFPPKCCSNLQYLNISNNKLTNIPMWIFNLCSIIEELEISGNDFNIDMPSIQIISRCKLTKLSLLFMNNCNLKNNGIQILQNIPNLKKLSVSNITNNYRNTIQQLPLKKFASVATLTELYFSKLGCSVLNEDICDLFALEVLNISYNHISWLPANFTNLKLLRILNLSHNELLSIPTDIVDLTNLVKLDLSHNLIGSLPSSMTNLINLKELDCYSNDLIDTALLIINKITFLVELDIEQNSFTMNEDLNYLEKREKLRLRKGNRLIGAKLLEISSDEFNVTTTDDSSDEDDLKCEIVTTEEQEEENWDCDCDDSIEDDSFLVLPPYKFTLNRKKVSYNPSDYIDPICFEDAPEDCT